MPTFVQSCEDARPASGAYRGGGEGVGESNATLGQQIEVRRLDNRVAGTAQEICPLVIGENKKNIWTL